MTDAAAGIRRTAQRDVTIGFEPFGRVCRQHRMSVLGELIPVNAGATLICKYLCKYLGTRDQGCA